MPIQEITLAVATLCHAALLYFWRKVEPPEHFNKMLSRVMDTDKLRGRPTRFLSKVGRYFRLQAEVIWIARWSLGDLLRALFFSLGIGAAIFLVTALALQVFLPQLADMGFLERIEYTGRILFLGLLDALSFDLFAVLGIEAKPYIPTLHGRAVVWAFYALEVVVLFRAIIAVVINIWTAAVAIVLPEPALRLANENWHERPPGSRLRKVLGTVTTL